MCRCLQPDCLRCICGARRPGRRPRGLAPAPARPRPRTRRAGHRRGARGDRPRHGVDVPVDRARRRCRRRGGDGRRRRTRP
ncbi:MAG TPA: hypothetical protein DCS55_16920 [Acidimicrobiaceae bacterium]|nr:hypothetical protein [Acidimicrobiaceae bacterium]